MNFEKALDNFECGNVYHLQWMNEYLVVADKDPTVWETCPFTHHQIPHSTEKMNLQQFTSTIIERLKVYYIRLELTGQP